MESGFVPAIAEVVKRLPLARVGAHAASAAKDVAAPATVLLARIASSPQARIVGGIDDAIAFEAMTLLVGVAKTSQVQQCPCLVCPTAFAAKTAPFLAVE